MSTMWSRRPDSRSRKAGRLPLQEGVGEALERLADHDEPAGRGIRAPEVEVRQPAPAAAAPPLGGQDHQVEGVDRLDLPPRRPPAAGLVGRPDRLHHHALVAGGQGPGLEGEGRVEVVGRPATGTRGTPMRSRAADRSARGRSSRSSPSRWRQSKNHTPSDARPGGPVRRPKLLIVSWNASGPSSLTPRISPSSTTWSRSSDRRRSTTAGRRSVMSLRLRVKRRTSSPRRWAWMRAPSSFHSTELRAELGEGRGHVGRGGGEHGQDRAEDVEADGGQARLALGEGDGRHPGQVAGRA